MKRLSIELKGFDQKAVADFSTANVTGGSVYGAQYRPGIVMNQNTATHVRQLLTVSPAGAGTDYYFMKESGAGEGSIAPTSEKGATAATTQATGLKPQFDLDLVESSVKFETIAGWMALSKKSINNIPGLISFLQKRVPEKLMDVEDAQVLYGSGTTPNIKGILTSGNFTAGSAAGATALIEKIINDLSSFEDTYKRIATGIVLRPSDYYSFFKNKASGSGEYDLPQGVSFVNGVLYILGVPVVKTTALTTNDYVVGDWANGAELLIQEGMKIEFFEQDGTNVRTNQVTLRVEETIALPVFGSDYFLKGSSAAV
jgi:HK97 family phage major capsid protein